jgi:hypothetical protein
MTPIVRYQATESVSFIPAIFTLSAAANNSIDRMQWLPVTVDFEHVLSSEARS